MKDNLFLDMYLVFYVRILYIQICNCVFIQYFSFYVLVDMYRMVVVFNIMVVVLEDELMQLILEGLISVCVDLYSKILYVWDVDQCSIIFEKFLLMGKEFQCCVKVMMLWVVVFCNQIYVKFLFREGSQGELILVNSQFWMSINM